MPLYDYECGACDAQVEVQHKMAEAPRLACAHCGAAMQRILSPTRLSSGHTSPTAAKHARLTRADEARRERPLQAALRGLLVPASEQVGPDAEEG
ncbi:MAG: zinc ribbon domain-containing protein [Deltaproteobacteria bacterium]|nr:zinc ribbon domain-containing protein [Deltaproteobacteria bacterium]